MICADGTPITAPVNVSACPARRLTPKYQRDWRHRTGRSQSKLYTNQEISDIRTQAKAEALREASDAYPLETAYGGAEHAVLWLKQRADEIHEAVPTGAASVIQGGLMKLSINGNDVELADPDEGAIITDVVILRRAVIHGDDGKLLDSIFIDNSQQTTRILQIGMIEAARKSVNVWDEAGE